MSGPLLTEPERQALGWYVERLYLHGEDEEGLIRLVDHIARRCLGEKRKK